MKKETILVTGINGFVGEHLAHHLKDEGYDVYGVGRESRPGENVAKYTDKYTQADFLDKESVQKIPLKSASAIIHLAGLASVADSFNHPDFYISGNATMTDNLLSTASAQEFSGRVVVVSTGALYDPRQEMPLLESSLTSESSPYAIGKLRAEDIAKSYNHQGLSVVIARPFNHIGPGQGTGFLVPDLYTQLQQAEMEGKKEILVGNLNTRRDYTDVRDIVKAYTRLALAPSLKYDTYNIASGVSYSGLQILDSLMQAANIKDLNPTIDPSRVRPTDALDIIGDSNRLKDELGWEPSSTVQQAIKDFVERKKNTA